MNNLIPKANDSSGVLNLNVRIFFHDSIHGFTNDFKVALNGPLQNNILSILFKTSLAPGEERLDFVNRLFNFV